MLGIFNYLDNHKNFWNNVPTHQKVFAAEIITITAIVLRVGIGIQAARLPDSPIFKSYSVGELTACATFLIALFQMNLSGWQASKSQG